MNTITLPSTYRNELLSDVNFDEIEGMIINQYQDFPVEGNIPETEFHRINKLNLSETMEFLDMINRAQRSEITLQQEPRSEHSEGILDSDSAKEENQIFEGYANIDQTNIEKEEQDNNFYDIGVDYYEEDTPNVPDISLISSEISSLTESSIQTVLPKRSIKRIKIDSVTQLSNTSIKNNLKKKPSDTIIERPVTYKKRKSHGLFVFDLPSTEFPSPLIDLW